MGARAAKGVGTWKTRGQGKHIGVLDVGLTYVFRDGVGIAGGQHEGVNSERRDIMALSRSCDEFRSIRTRHVSHPRLSWPTFPIGDPRSPGHSPICWLGTLAARPSCEIAWYLCSEAIPASAFVVGFWICFLLQCRRHFAQTPTSVMLPYAISLQRALLLIVTYKIYKSRYN